MWNPYNIIKYWLFFIKELFLLIKVYHAVKGVEKELYEQGLRIDWIGRIYAVINLEGEELNQPEILQQSIVIQALNPISLILMKYGLSDVMYPDIRKIDNSDSYLVILYPETDYVEFGAFLTASLMTVIYAFTTMLLFTSVIPALINMM
jgi:hypothetical protein